MVSETQLDLGRTLHIVPDHQLRTQNGGKTLISHQPVHVLKLGTAGARLVAGWFGGAPIANAEAHRKLAHRLVSGGYAHYQPSDRSSGTGDSRQLLTVVVPVRDDLVGLCSTIDALLADGSTSLAQIVVVDDGSQQPVTNERLQLHRSHLNNVLIVRSGRSGGPAAARNVGLRTVTTPIVAFVDAGVVICSSDLEDLVELVRHPGVVAAAPRIVAERVDSVIGRYEQASSPLDMGPAASVVSHDHRVGYVPSACLVGRTAAVLDGNGFDQSLRFGEDVDLVWKLAKQGIVLYHPRVVASHPPRLTMVDFVKQRFSYGTSAGPLAKRHQSRLAPLSASSWFVDATVVTAGLGPKVGAPAAAVLLARRTNHIAKAMKTINDPNAEAAVLVARETAGQIEGAFTALRRPYSPLLALAALCGGPAVSRLSQGLLALTFGRRSMQLDRSSARGLATAAGLAAIDDLAYSTGVIVGSVRSGTWAALTPTLRRGRDRAADRC